MTPTQNAPFKNPCETVEPGDDYHRTTFVTTKKVQHRIDGYRLRKGTLQTTANILIDKLLNELRRSNLSEYDPDRYEVAVANATVRLPDDYYTGSTSPNTEPATETPRGNDGRGVATVARVDTGTPAVAPNPARTPKASKSGKSRKRSRSR
jgi:hypothetical protein